MSIHYPALESRRKRLREKNNNNSNNKCFKVVYLFPTIEPVDIAGRKNQNEFTIDDNDVKRTNIFTMKFFYTILNTQNDLFTLFTRAMS